MSNDKRIIETAFPVKEVSEQGHRDRYNRQITGLHTWWTRKPLAPSRATAYAALTKIPPPTSQAYSISNNTPELPRKQDFIVQLSKWENALKPLWIDEARRDILDSHGGTPPKVLDPFGGGGSIPLEAQRLGCETHSCDLNPVAVLIQKCTLEFPQKYGQRFLDDVQKWGERILAQVEEELQPFYPNEPDGSMPFAYIWARTVPCQNLSCSAEIPLLKQYWLANRATKRVTLFPYEEAGSVAFQIVGTGYEPMPNDFDPAKGTVARGVVTCPLCKSTIPAAETRRLFQGGLAGERMLAVVTLHPNVKGRRYRLAGDVDIEVFGAAQKRISEKRARFSAEWDIDPVPDEPTPKIKGSGAERAIGIHNYNMSSYGSLFNARQQLALVTLVEKIRETHSEMLLQNHPTDYCRAVATCLGLCLNQMTDSSSSLCRWAPPSETVVGVFSGPAIMIVWNYAEANPFPLAANKLKNLLKPFGHLSEMRAQPAVVRQESAKHLPYPDNTFDAVLTDPPYYDSVPYAYLADFFYVWFKRSIGAFYPELFKESLTPKEDEIVAYGNREGGLEAGKLRFEEGLSKAFSEIHRVLKPNGIAVIVYAHKSTSGWETLINALLDSGLVITAAWPINTEMKSRLWAVNVAALASSIYMIVRKREREPFGLYREVHAELEEYLKTRYVELWESGISGADLFIAVIGSALQIFGKYEEVTDFEGNPIRADRMLRDIRQLTATYAVAQVGQNASQLTQFYLFSRQEHGEKRVQFDAANQLARSLGIDLTAEWGERKFICQEGSFVRVLGAHERHIDDVADSEELIDVLHHALLLWRSGEREAMVQSLARGEVGVNELIWNVAQAVSLALPLEAEERRWLEGWLADREAIKADVSAFLLEPEQETFGY